MRRGCDPTPLFLGGCIPVRLGLAALVGWSLWRPRRGRLSCMPPVLAVVLYAVAVGFTVIHWAGWRRTGIETCGAPVWWDAWRPVHALLYALAALAVAAAAGDDPGPTRAVALAVLLLLLDPVVGLGVWATSD